MRMNKVLVGLLVLGLAVSVVGMIGLAKKPKEPVVVGSGDVADQVSWTIQQYIEITIDDSAFDFGQIAAGADTVTEEKANTLFIHSNTNWRLSFAVKGNGSENLSVSLSSDDGKANAEINVGYTLKDLRSMDAGDYTATVTYTVTAK